VFCFFIEKNGIVSDKRSSFSKSIVPSVFSETSRRFLRFGRAPARRTNELFRPELSQSGFGQLSGLLEDVDGPDIVVAARHSVPEPARPALPYPDPGSSHCTTEATLPSTLSALIN
jgi:hypothetical protein